MEVACKSLKRKKPIPFPYTNLDLNTLPIRAPGRERFPNAQSGRRFVSRAGSGGAGAQGSEQAPGPEHRAAAPGPPRDQPGSPRVRTWPMVTLPSRLLPTSGPQPCTHALPTAGCALPSKGSSCVPTTSPETGRSGGNTASCLSLNTTRPSRPKLFNDPRLFQTESPHRLPQPKHTRPPPLRHTPTSTSSRSKEAKKERAHL